MLVPGLFIWLFIWTISESTGRGAAFQPAGQPNAYFGSKMYFSAQKTPFLSESMQFTEVRVEYGFLTKKCKKEKNIGVESKVSCS